MTRNFWRWEVDPFFPAAEEVQDSTDRLESAYRTWIHTRCTASTPEDDSAFEFRRRELSTSLGTAKWQLEEFERAVSGLVADDKRHAGEDASERHSQFVQAIRNQITSIEQALLDSEDRMDLKALPVVKLDQEDTDDFAQFLSGARVCGSNDAERVSPNFPLNHKMDVEAPCTPSRSVERKSGMPQKCLASECRCNTVMPKTERLKPGTYSQPPVHGSADNLCVIDRPPVRGKLAAAFVEINCEQSDVSDPASEYSYLERRVYTDGERGGNLTEHQRSASVGSGLNSWKSGRVLKGTKASEHGRMEGSSSGVNLWSLFKKRQHAVDLRISKSGLKRLKDGDCKSRDRAAITCYYKPMQGTTDLEKGSGSTWLGGNLSYLNRYASGGIVNGDSKQYKGWGEALQSLQRTHYVLPTSRPVQIASAILVVLGLLGLLSFHVSSSAF